MRLIYPSAKAFSKAMEVVWNIIDEGTFKLTKEGLKLMAVDPSQISMIVFELPKELFEVYEVENPSNNGQEADPSLGLDISYIKNILKTARASEKISLEKKDNRLSITFFTEKSKRNFIIPLLELTDSVNMEPAIEYNNSASVDADALKNIIRDASIASNYVMLVLTPDGLKAQAKSEIGEVSEEFEKGEEVVELNVETGAQSLYPIKYLEDILKTIKKGDVLRLFIETDKPLKVEFNVEGAAIRYYLAPAARED